MISWAALAQRSLIHSHPPEAETISLLVQDYSFLDDQRLGEKNFPL
jgi:hypothetical protein